MAQERQPAEAVPATEQQDRGLFGLFGKKEEKHDEGQAHSQAAAQAPIHHDNPLVSHGNDKQEALHGKLHRTHSSSSSSSSDEDESGEKKGGGRKKKGLKEKIKEKLSGHHDEKNKKEEHGQGHQEAHKSEAEKKGVLEKIKEKLPGHHHKEGEEGHVARD